MKSLPKLPNLEFLAKQAKELRSLHRQGATACCQRIRECDTSMRSRSNEEILATRFSINDAQRIIAREYGYSSWATLKNYVESLRSPLYNGVSDKAAYHKTITDSYDQRSVIYDNHVWAREDAQQTVDFSPPQPGDTVLDVACGAGNVSFYLADLVGPTGDITGVDISAGMIRRCKEKAADANYSHLKFLLADAEDLVFARNSFDRIYCAGGLYWMINPQAALRHWFEFLKPGGWIGFNAWPSSSFVWGAGERQALREHGVMFTTMEFSANRAKVGELIELAGFESISVHVVERGRWVSADELKGPIQAGGYTPGQYPDPRSNVAEEVLLAAQRSYEAEIDRRTTEKGVWHDMTCYFAYARKPM